MDIRQFDWVVIRPVLETLAPEIPVSEAARRLLLGTAAHESRGLHYLEQWTGPDDRTLGPAIGVYQIEAPTHIDLFRNFLDVRLPKRAAMRAKVMAYRGAVPLPNLQLATNLAYATAVARLIYYRAAPPLPAADDRAGLAAYWKQHFNTPQGKGTVEKWLNDAGRFGVFDF